MAALGSVASTTTAADENLWIDWLAALLAELLMCCNTHDTLLTKHSNWYGGVPVFITSQSNSPTANKVLRTERALRVAGAAPHCSQCLC